MNDLTYIPTQEEIYLAHSNGSESPSFDVIEKIKHTSASEIYDGVFKSSFHAMYVENSDGQIMKFNKQFCQLFGYSASETADLENADLFETNENSFLLFCDQRNNKGISKGEITGIKKSGERFPCRISSVIYKSDSGDTRAMNTLVNTSENLSARWNFGG